MINIPMIPLTMSFWPFSRASAEPPERKNPSTPYKKNTSAAANISVMSGFMIRRLTFPTKVTSGETFVAAACATCTPNNELRIVSMKQSGPDGYRGRS